MAGIDNIASLVKALEAGSYNAAPGSLVQGSALQVEDLSAVMNITTFENKHLKLAKMLGSESCKSTLAQFDRQLSFGEFGGGAMLEGNVGQEQTSEFVRIVVPMCFYSHTRRVTLASTMVGTMDGKKSDERAAQDAAIKVAADIEFDSFRGRADFSNAGVFDGNPAAMPGVMPNIIGVDVHVRQSDILRNAQDLMFNEFGSSDSVVLPGGGTLTQDLVEDLSVRSALNFGEADKLLVAPTVLANYNKIVFGKERIILAGGAQESTGADLRKQWVSGGVVSMEASNFLRGKTQPARARSDGPAAPASCTPASVTGSVVTSFLAGEVYQYYVTAGNEIGESVACASASVTVAVDGDQIDVAIADPASGTWRFFNVYRSAAGGTAASAKFIGRIVAASSTSFKDLGNKLPGFSTGFLVEANAMGFKELCPYSRLKLAQTDLSLPEAHFAFKTLVVPLPRHMALADNLL